MGDRQRIAVQFQFHKGTIRTFDTYTFADGTPLFQFHKGTIRTHCTATAEGKDFNFNSIKVRLEQPLPNECIVAFTFQFHKGTIRTPLNFRRRCPQNLWVCECKDTKNLQKNVDA